MNRAVANRRLARPQTAPSPDAELSGWLHALVSALEAKDPYTCGHSDRVARLSVRLGQRLGLPAGDLRTLYVSGLMHDVGKIGVPEPILRKQGPLTPEERDVICEHPDQGYRMLRPVAALAEALPAVRHHHEAWDGSGYPDGLEGPAIPRAARIVAVADALDAMTSHRSYRAALSPERADDILRAGAGRQWDPEVVSAYAAERDTLASIAHAPLGRAQRD